MKKYLVYIDDGELVYKTAVPAKNEDDARDYMKGNGEIITVKDITDSVIIFDHDVSAALMEAGFNKNSIEIIVNGLTRLGLIDD